ncbi:MAG: fibronectin type III domain-containing protein [Ruminococcaceae bacterium]|nr:fibronectin type III domain-containing protein [Oscillospiraceae bacterium]
MKKKIISLLLSVAVLMTALIPFAAFAKSSTPVWDKYSKEGSYKVSSFTFTIPENDFTYKVWYPKDIKNMSKRPIILYCNGTSANYEKKPTTVTYLKKAASYGFVCLTNTDENTGLGTSMNLGMDALIIFNGDKKHRLYNKLNLDKVGLAGHSQGATCCMNLASKGNYDNLKHFKAIYACSLPSPAIAASGLQNCPYDSSLVSLPTLLVSGSGTTDNAFISPLESSIIPALNNIKNDVYAARMTDVEHADSIYDTHPYMIAWFDYKLNGNKTAEKAFVGKSPELKTNKNFQDFKRKIYCKKVSLKAVKANKKGFKAEWKTVTGVKGYQLQYSTSKSFTEKTTKSITLKKTTASKTVKSLKAKKSYYVRIRTYRTVGGINYYGKWSAVKTVKTK